MKFSPKNHEEIIDVDVLEQLDVAVIYRTDISEAGEDSFKFDIRRSSDLSDVRFSKDQNEEWIDIGGFTTWKAYNFPCFKLDEKYALEELDLKKEIIVICPKKTIILAKQQ